MMPLLAGLSAVLTGIGVAQALVGAWLVGRFAAGARRDKNLGPNHDHAIAPDHGKIPGPVTILKPLHGDEPLLHEALSTLCEQDYPAWQIVFGVANIADPAAAVVGALQADFPDRDIALVVDQTLHGPNRKVGNLINMIPAAKHDIIVIADSDVHVRPDYLSQLVDALCQPGVGLVTTLYAGLPAGRALSQQLGATQITHGFLPGAVLSRAVGRQDCLGATMCLRRRDLDRIGGFQALVAHLADDNVLGRRIAALGLRVALAGTVPLTTVPETTMRALFRHELRWARTIRALEPAGFAASVLQYPLAWGLLTILIAGGAIWAVGLFFLAWTLRAVAAVGVDSALLPLWAEERGSNANAALAFSCPVWLLPLRDILSVAVLLASYGGRHVEWRGHGLQADTPKPITGQPKPLRPIEGTDTR